MNNEEFYSQCTSQKLEKYYTDMESLFYKIWDKQHKSLLKSLAHRMIICGKAFDTKYQEEIFSSTNNKLI